MGFVCLHFGGSGKCSKTSLNQWMEPVLEKVRGKAKYFSRRARPPLAPVVLAGVRGTGIAVIGGERVRDQG